MADVLRLKKKAADHEARRQYDRAIGVYEQIIADSSSGPREANAPLFNRIGDLHFRLGDLDKALTYYERAVDLYSELGFFNNAIALCNKILRQAPNRSSIYYKLGKISARKGFNSDAKQNFLEYAGRMQRTGQVDEAFRALKEFADLCPGQDDVRLMLADQLTRANRKTEALEQLQMLYDQLASEERHAEANATIERMRAIDPSAQPQRPSGPVKRRTDELVFLSLADDDEPLETAAPTPPAPIPVPGLETTSLSETPVGRARPLTPQEFATMQFPDKGQQPTPEVERALHDLAHLPPLEGTTARTAAVEGFEPTATPAREAPAKRQTPAEAAAAGTEQDALAPMADDSERPSEPARFAETHTPTPAPIAPPAADVGRPSTPPIRPAAQEEDLVDLGEWLRSEQKPLTTRMVAEHEPPPEGEQVEFAEMLAKFKQGIAEQMDPEDYGSHYDLGLAFKAMGLVDEAIGEFQKSLPSDEHRMPAYEALGECFVEKRQHEVAITLLERAVRDPGFRDEQGLGVLYLLGLAHEAIGRQAEAAALYQRVLAVDINFRDVSERLAVVAQNSG